MTEPTDRFTVSVYASELTHAEAARAAEVLARPLAGLGLDGIGASLTVRPDRADVPTEDEPDAADCIDGKRARARLLALAARWATDGSGEHATELRGLVDGLVL